MSTSSHNGKIASYLKWLLIANTIVIIILCACQFISMRIIFHSAKNDHVSKPFVWESINMAAHEGDDTEVKQYLRVGADINQRDGFRRTPLIWAARSGNLDLVKYLLKNGADVNAMDQNDDTPLKEAARSGHLDIVNILVEDGADVNIAGQTVTGGHSTTALECAARGKHYDIVDFLIQNGAATSKYYERLMQRDATDSK